MEQKNIAPGKISYLFKQRNQWISYQEFIKGDSNLNQTTVLTIYRILLKLDCRKKSQ
jgi:hypothetical protein